MKELFAQIEEKMQEFSSNAQNQIEKGNKTAGTRARKASLEIEKMLKEFRKESIAAAK